VVAQQALHDAAAVLQQGELAVPEEAPAEQPVALAVLLARGAREAALLSAADLLVFPVRRLAPSPSARSAHAMEGQLLTGPP